MRKTHSSKQRVLFEHLYLIKPN